MSDKKNREFVQRHYEDGKLYNLEAVRLWLKGKDAWNKWVEENPECYVDFSEVDFGYLREQCNNDDISFSLFKFPNGNVDFSAAQFGEGNVDFSHTQFVEGDVDFSGAQFGEGYVDFYKAQFGEGNVLFSYAQFGEGNVLFSNVQFGEGYVFFSYAQFGEGNMFFSGAQFGEGNVNFYKALFGKGNVNFYETQFGEGNVDFSRAQFDEDVNFQLIQVGGNLILRELEESSEITSFSMMGASIDGLLSLSNNAFNCVPDLTETNIKHDVELQTLNVRLKRERLNRKGFWVEKSQDSRDIERLRKLKQIAENNKHHEAALRFHADEMRAKRWHKKEDGGFGFFGSVLDLLYSAACRYGQSIARPFIGLAITWCCFFAAFQYFIISQCKNADWIKTAIFVISNSLPFISVAKEVRKDFSELYFAESLNLYYSLVITQAVFSLLFVFLIGLGLRNRFRL